MKTALDSQPSDIFFTTLQISSIASYWILQSDGILSRSSEWTQFHSDFASQPGHWGGSLSGSDLVVDLAELLLIRWIVLVDTGESPLYSSPPIASEMTHFQRVKRFLCAKTLKRFCYTLTPHILSWKFNLNKLKFSQFSIALSVLATSLPRR